MSALGIRPTYEMIYQNAVNIDGLALRYFRFWLDRDHAGWEEGLEPLDKEEAKQAMRLQRNEEVLQVANLIRQQGWTDPIANGLLSVISNERSYFDKLVSSLYPLWKSSPLAARRNCSRPTMTTLMIRARCSTGTG